MDVSDLILDHIAIPLLVKEDIQRFYNDVLGFTEKYRFLVDKETAQRIFPVDNEITVSLIERSGLKIELYHLEEQYKAGIMHICFTLAEIEAICQKAENAGYRVIRIVRPSGLIAFIYDGTGNCFEIKEPGKFNGQHSSVFSDF